MVFLILFVFKTLFLQVSLVPCGKPFAVKRTASTVSTHVLPAVPVSYLFEFDSSG